MGFDNFRANVLLRVLIFVTLCFATTWGWLNTQWVVTPIVLGRRLELNPVMVFLGLTFWWWIWGIPGGLLAVPILGTAKLVCDRIPPLAPVATLLGR